MSFLESVNQQSGARMVVVPKGNKKVRICVDLTRLNQSVCRERHPLPAVEQALAQLAGARVFSTLDANSGFWQIPLDQESALLMTSINNSLREILFPPFAFWHNFSTRTFSEVHVGHPSRPEGAVCMMDDVLSIW